MLKKHGLALLIAVIVIQLCVPLGMVMSTVAASSKAEKYGTEYKIRLSYIRYDIKHGAINYDYYLGYLYSQYFTVSEGEEGFAELTPVSEKPEHSSYLEFEKSGYHYVFPSNRFYVGKLKNVNALWLDDSQEEDFMTPYNEFVAHYTEAYLDCYVYNGKISVKELYIDGVPAKEFIAIIDANEEATQPLQE